MKWAIMSSPTPSVDSLVLGGPTLGSFLEGGVESGLGLELHHNNGCHGSSSSSSTCSSIIFPHLSISNGVLSNGYGGSPEHLRSGGGDFSGLSSPISASSLQASSKCGLCHDSLARPKVQYCMDCLEKASPEVGDRLLVSPEVSWEDCQTSSQSYSSTLDLLKSFETASTRLQSLYVKAQNEITEAFSFYRSLLDERKNELLKELEGMYTTRQVTLSVVTQRVQETLDRMYQAVEFGDRLLRDASPPQVLVFKKLLETRLQAISATVPEPFLAMASAAAGGDLEFVANYSAMQNAVRTTSGYIRCAGAGMAGPLESLGKHQQHPIPPIARPMPTHQEQPSVNGFHHSNHQGSTGQLKPTHTQHHHLIDPTQPKRFSNTVSPPYHQQMDLGGLTYEKWSNASEASYQQNGHAETFTSNNNGTSIMNDFILSAGGRNSEQSEIEPGHQNLSSSKLMTPMSFPKTPGIKRQKMIYHCKFGEFGTSESQFTEPSGVTVNGNNEIIVADTNNHRIQIFDREGRFKFQFGECGKRDGQLLYPNRAAVCKPSGDIVVTERSPTHQIQIYNQYGQFVRKFGANILQHPRGVTVDSKGRIIVVECKVMRVIIFDQMGTVLSKFGCSKHLEFPNGVVVNDRQEIFISDNRAHCVKVFNYEGVFLRQIGGEGLTNYPIGVGINSNGEILVADNHNNFNLTVFTQDGQLVSALESKVKHAQCFDVALMDEGSVVLASKDYRLYIYRYVQVPPISLGE